MIKNDVEISNEVSIIRNNVCMEHFVPTFHLRLVYKQLINAFDQKVRDSYKRKNGPKWNQNGPEDLTDKLFDYPSYFERINRDFKKTDFTGIAFDEDRIDIKYKHNTPPVEFFNYFVNDADLQEKRRKFDENDVRFIKFEPHDRKFILAKHRFEQDGFDAVCLIYHKFDKSKVSELNLVYWVIVVGIDKKVELDYEGVGT